MSGLRVCGCLNWSVHCQEVQSCDLRQKAPLADPFFKGGLVCAKLAPQGITKRHSFLESVRTVGDWEVHSCQGCHQDVYAQASDRSLLLSANLESDIKRIEAMRASADYSPCFHVLLPPVADNEGEAANVAPGVTEEEALVARLHVQQLAAQFLQNELEAMEARLRLYQEQQAQALERLRLRTARDQDALWHIIVSKSGGQEQVSAGRVTSVKQRPMAPQMPDVKCRVAAQLEGEMFQLDGFEEDEAAFPSSEEEHSDDDGNSSSSSALDEPVRHCAYSLPVDMPRWRPRDDDHQFAVEHDRIGANIEALARSVCDGTEMFGDLPRPRLNSMQRPLF